MEEAKRNAGDLHAAIMNLMGRSDASFDSPEDRRLYREGHRDARHAAAELAAAASADMAELVEALRRISLAKPDQLDHAIDVSIIQRAARIAREALSKHTGA